MTTIDPGLVKLGFFGLMFVGKMIISANNKQKAKNKALRPPQSSPGPRPIGSVGPNASMKTARSSNQSSNQNPLRDQKPMRNAPTAQTQDAGSPWSSTKGPFDS